MSRLGARPLLAIGNTFNHEAIYGHAISCYQHALEIFERDPDVDPIFIANTLNSLGQACYFQGQYKDSLLSHERVLDLVGRDKYKAIEILPRIASVYIAQGDYEKAIAMSKQALALCDAFSIQNSSFRAYSSRNLGEAYLLTRRPEDSFPYLETALKIYRADLGEWDQWTARAITLMGQYHHYQNDFTKAESYFDLAIQITSDLFGKIHMGSVVTMEAYSDFLIDTQRAPQAIDILQQILRLYRDEVGEANIRSTRALHLLGKGYAKLDNSDEAITHYLQALEIIELHYGRDYNPEAGHIMRNLALAYRAKGEENKAIEKLRQALTLLIKYFGANHVFATEVRKELSE
jgi:tetratricopeptide (TPR) repeat protein